MNHYEQLDNAFAELEQTRQNILFDINDVQTAQDIITMKDVLDSHGVIVLQNATSKQSVKALHQNIADCAQNMYDLSCSDIFNDLNPYRNPANGFGNVSFSYFFKQPCSKDDTLHTTIGSDKTYLTENYGYQVNLKLLEDNSHTYAVLLALTHPTDGMVSWDSFKLANNPKPKPKTMTKQTLTKCHFDAYGGGVDKDVTERFQAIISFEDKIKLGYVPDSINPKIKALITKISKNNSLYQQDGFKSFTDQKLLDVFNKYIIAPPTGALVLWKSGIIHYEAEFKGQSDSLYNYASSTNLPNQKRIRCIVGLHKPQNLSQDELTELARLAENGLIPAMYQNINKNSKVHSNIMCSKRTQYKVYRNITTNNRKKFDKTIKDDDYSILDDLTNLKKHMYGIHQSIEDLEMSDTDKEMILESMNESTKSIKIIKKKSKRKIAPKIAPRNGKKRKAVARRA
jgi:hypothetical protein